MSHYISSVIVSAIALALLLPACRKKDTAITSGMGGTRGWHRSHYFKASGMHYPTPILESYFLPDTTITLSIISDTSVAFGSADYKYDETDATNKIHFFGTAANFYRYKEGVGIAYFYTKDSIVFCSGMYHNTSDYIERRDLAYTF